MLIYQRVSAHRRLFCPFCLVLTVCNICMYVGKTAMLMNVNDKSHRFVCLFVSEKFDERQAGFAFSWWPMPLRRNTGSGGGGRGQPKKPFGTHRWCALCVVYLVNIKLMLPKTERIHLLCIVESSYFGISLGGHNKAASGNSFNGVFLLCLSVM